MRITKLFIYIFLFISTSLSIYPKEKIIVGAEVLINEKLDLLKNKRIGIVTNSTAILSDGKHLIDTLNSIPTIKVKALYSPEHGLRGNFPAGKKFTESKDKATGIPIYSLYGKHFAPTKENLKNIDVLLFDIQDIGARFYTYISTLYKVIESAAKNNIKLIVLDRPNPLGGIEVAGPIVEKNFFSFIGIAPIPIRHGMTIGEIANLFNNEFVKNKADVTVIKMKNWKRELYLDQCNLPWVKPSPNIVNMDAILVYPGLCFFEATNMSEGRGTMEPFIKFGAPFINSQKLLAELGNTEGITFNECSFTPQNIPHMATNVKWKGKKCYGLKAIKIEKNKFKPIEFGVKLFVALHKLYPKKFVIKKKNVGRIYGNNNFYDMLLADKTADEIISLWKKNLIEFDELRNNYLLY